jgi:hypothetical protein
MTPNPKLAGYAELKGSATQMAAVKENPDFLRLCADATLIVEEFTVTDGYCDEGVAEQVSYFQEAIARVPQTV